jgi:uncharacterized protein (DUF1810 family)
VTSSGSSSDPFELVRFEKAQAGVYEEVVAELRQGLKQGHWMWFIFPQIEGLGSSWMADRYSISSRAEAEAYLAHPVLGPRLLECTRLMNAVIGRSLREILGSVDALKFRSCMTLFGEVPGAPAAFAEALLKYCGGEKDELTLDRL